MTRVGFTGSRHGLSLVQEAVIKREFAQLGITELHEGCCEGGDHEVWLIAQSWPSRIRIVGHPPINPKLRVEHGHDEERRARDYLIRDEDIVNETEFLVAAPQWPEKDPLSARSGTWYTINHARLMQRPRIIIYPDGTVIGERE